MTRKKTRVSWGILKFPLPEEQEAFNYARDGILYSIVLTEFMEYLLRQRDSDGCSVKKYEMLDALIKELLEIAQERRIQIL